jgi:hypothetical protein
MFFSHGIPLGLVFDILELELADGGCSHGRSWALISRDQDSLAITLVDFEASI